MILEMYRVVRVKGGSRDVKEGCLVYMLARLDGYV